MNSETKKFWCCPECGCTDVQAQVWAHANTDEILDSCESYNWCPQCEDDTGDGEHKYLAQTDTEQPLRGSRVMVIEDLMSPLRMWFTDDDPIERAYRSTQP